tara:strand:+ start:165 stop:1274 length:1110 start_codon:yes stop_codon:yes gene_type:complete
MALTQTPEEGLKVSNAPSDGKFLQYKDGTDKLTWADAGSGTMSNVVEDTSPQLGANLDVQAYSITTATTDGNVTIQPNGSGFVNLNGDVRFPGSATNQFCFWDQSDQALEFWDQAGGYAKASFGAGGDFDIYHDGTDNQLKSTNGKVVITTTAGDSDIEITPNGTGDVVIDGLKYPQADGSAGQFLKTDGSGTLSFATVSTDPTTTSGTNNFTVADGNLVIGTAGHGIDFSAVGAGSSVTAAENLLDDYECGTWTPSVVTGTVSSEGYYVKVGNLVHVTFKIHTWSDDTSGQPIIMNVRPFAAPRVKTIFSTQITFFGDRHAVAIHLETNNNWYMQYQTMSGGTSNFNHSDITDKDSCNLWVSGTYTIA